MQRDIGNIAHCRDTNTNDRAAVLSIRRPGHATVIGLTSYTGDTGARAPSISNYLFLSVNFRAAQSMTATLCGCLSKHICILRQQLR